MSETEKLLKKLLTPPTPEQITRRQRTAAAIRSMQVDITPLTVVELRRMAREEDLLDGEERCLDP